MTNQDIINYFSEQTVYVWNGTQQELHEAQLAAGAGYNLLIADYKIYFVSQGEVNDNRASLLSIEE